VELLTRVAERVGETVAGNWLYLVLGVVSAAALSVYVGTDRVGSWLRRRTSVATAGSVGAAVATPFCSCGTTAVVLSMMAATAPWAPIVAFMVASPLTSPAHLFLSGGLLGWPFTWIFFGGTILLGLVAGALTAGVERLGWLQNQARFRWEGRGCSRGDDDGTSCARQPGAVLGPRSRWKWRQLGTEILAVGRRLLIYFFGFAAIGYLVIELVPEEWVVSWLGGDSVLSIVVAATLGVPLYITTDASLPLIAGLVDGGMGAGPAMAFLVTGAGTSVGALTGALLIARWRVIAIVVAVLWFGAIALGLVAAALL
jgi:uncharacterized membrane protein YraQ (UPF0718 family)